MTSNLSVLSIIAGSILVVFLLLLFFVFWIRNRLRNGGTFSYKKFTLKRWYCPGENVNISDESLLNIVDNLRIVSKLSIGSVLKYPAIQADNINDIRKALSNKVILEIYKDGKIIAFHMAYISNFPHVHLGLIMVDKEYRGQGIQKISFLSMFALVLDWFCTGFYVSDIGFSSSGWRMFSEVVEDVYPNLYYNIEQKQYHIDIVHEILSKHRADTGISSEAVFDPESFVIIKSNSRAGGGAFELIPYSGTRISRHGSLAQRRLEELLDLEDEQIYVGHASLKFMCYQMLPITSGLLTLRWVILIALVLYHTYLIPNLRWYYHAGYSLMGFQVIFSAPSCTSLTDTPATASLGPRRLPTKPCLWVCNHFSWIDMWAMKVLNPEVYIVAKKDLLDEAPVGWKRDGFQAAFDKCQFLWYDRVNKDTTIRERMRHILLVEKRPIVIFAEGTSKSSGPPLAMHHGSVEIARECNVPIQLLCIRYNYPIGLEKTDDAMKNAMQLIRLSNKKVFIQILEEVQIPPKSGGDIDKDTTSVSASISSEARNSSSAPPPSSPSTSLSSSLSSSLTSCVTTSGMGCAVTDGTEDFRSMDDDEVMECLRRRIARAYSNAADVLGVPHRARGGSRGVHCRSKKD